ncbi:uncharacterized protein PADG_12380 [Paracoccidioides brasiliensis Pb18]|uniref:Fringe-like glycosyltransferase domain-containing protein n=1 Tax=Paracoccidioides brasiliensis (strain Pb18) TaxID=502780 RepID=A0A0A0HS86_PARBD|nr:uncharacterized protein PADG_12380 [Paracoccidioides brasiliensis Pb18]KGM91522.1 hypothetical protein PADG_12380 [Paracoccidioides brasiliensis Pb18]
MPALKETSAVALISTPMSYVRLKLLASVVVIFTIALFLWSLNHYNDAALNCLTNPGHRLSSALCSSFPSLSSSSSLPSHLPASPPSHHGTPQPKLEFGQPNQLCDTLGIATTHPLPFSEWLIAKNYTRTYLRTHHLAPETQFESLETLHGRVLQPFRPMNRGMTVDPSSDEISQPCPPIVDVDVAADHDPSHTSKILFGLATTTDRLRHFLPSLLYSYGSTQASLLVLIPSDTKNLREQEAFFRNAGLDITLQTSPLEYTARYFSLVNAFTSHIETHRPDTTWVSWVDDDTFFLSLPSLATNLSTLNTSKPIYLGSLSEASMQVDAWGHIGFGGAGIFVSVPLLEQLHEVYERCQVWGSQPGDQKLAQCIETFSDANLTTWDSLYQVDIRGVVDGLFESGRRIDSLHHWESWYKKDVVKMSTVAVVAGGRSILRRWRFDEGIILDEETRTRSKTFWVLTNGYSLVKYTLTDPKLSATDAVDFDKIEKTWDEEQGFERRLGPLRPKEQAGVRKERWLLEDAIVIGGDVYQSYVRDGEEGNARDGHSVIELVWLGSKI